MTNKITLEGIKAKIIKKIFSVIPETTITICCLTLENGYTVTGEDACVDPANFNQADGEKYAEEAAIDKIWPLEGYLLKEKLFKASGSVSERVTLERKELDEKIEKLTVFMRTPLFNKHIDVTEQERLRSQLEHMRHYSDVLGERLEFLAVG